MTNLPSEVGDYLQRVVAAAHGRFGPALIGVYGIGSLALGDWQARSSDIDVAIIAANADDADALRGLAADLDASRTPVPARKLELVVYDEARVRDGDVRFAMNFNTGRDAATTVELDASRVPAFWFVLDLAIARGGAVALHGPPMETVVAPLDRASVLEALEEALRWYAGEPDEPDGSLLAAARAWHHVSTGDWVAKSEAADWAARRLATEDPDLAAALTVAARRRSTGEGDPDPAAAGRLTERVLALVEGSATG